MNTRVLAALVGACAAALPAPDALAQAGDPLREPAIQRVREGFKVDGIALFDPHAEHAARMGVCAASIFAGLKWCVSGIVEETRGTAAYVKTTGYNIDGDARIVYAVSSRRGYPLKRDEFDGVIQGIGERFGTGAAVYALRRTGEGVEVDSLIAVWGGLRLVHLAEAEYATVETGGSLKRGHLVDHRFNLVASAKQRDPIYKIEGDAGFILHIVVTGTDRADVISRVVYQPAFLPAPAKPAAGPVNPLVGETARRPSAPVNGGPSAAERARLVDAERALAAERLLREEAERKAAEEGAARAEAEKKLAAERRASEELRQRLENARKAAEERARRSDADRKDKGGDERRAREETERKAAEEAARSEAKRAEAEAERRAAEEAKRAEAEAERKALEDRRRTERDEAERKAAAEAARQAEAERRALEARRQSEEAERKAAEERRRKIEAEKKAAAERRAAEEERGSEARRAREELARKARARAEAEERARVEAERKVAEEAARAEAERKAAEETRRADAERERAAEAERAAEEARKSEDKRAAERKAEAERSARERAARPAEWYRLAAEAAKRAGAIWSFDEIQDRVAEERTLRTQTIFAAADRLAVEVTFECLAGRVKRLRANARGFDQKSGAGVAFRTEGEGSFGVRTRIRLDDQPPQDGLLFRERQDDTASIVEAPVTAADLDKKTSRASIWLRHYVASLEFQLATGTVTAAITPYADNLRRVLEACAE